MDSDMITELMEDQQDNCYWVPAHKHNRSDNEILWFCCKGADEMVLTLIQNSHVVRKDLVEPVPSTWIIA